MQILFLRPGTCVVWYGILGNIQYGGTHIEVEAGNEHNRASS